MDSDNGWIEPEEGEEMDKLWRPRRRRILLDSEKPGALGRDLGKGGRRLLLTGQGVTSWPMSSLSKEEPREAISGDMLVSQ